MIASSSSFAGYRARIMALASFALAPAVAFVLASGAPAFAAAPALTNGDKPATVTIGERPLSADTDHVVAFKRGDVLYVCVQDLRQMVSGQTTHSGDHYVVESFKGDANSKTYAFTIGSNQVRTGGKTVALSAPVIRAYGHVYIPISFFSSGAVKTKVSMSADGRTGDIILPPGM